MGTGCTQPVEFTLGYCRHLHYSGSVCVCINVEPRGVEPLTSAVQSQTNMCRRLPYSARDTLE
jgi:hypothetical protein